MMSVVMLLTLLAASNTIANAQTYDANGHRKVSSRAKGAVIGGAGGAVVGGLIGHNVGGALIGAGLGAGAGYVVGDAKDRSALRKRQAYRRAHPAAPKVVYVEKKPTSVTTTTTTKRYN